jgi:hypothetical protein
MTRSESQVVLVPIFAGLRSKELMASADASKIDTTWVSLPPLSFDQCANIVRDLVGREQLRESCVREAAFKYGGVPARIVGLCHDYVKTKNWAEALAICSALWMKSMEKVRENLDAKQLELMIALAVTGQPVNGRLSLDSLERCGACVFLDRTAGTITVPVAVLILFASDAVVHDKSQDTPVTSASDGLKDSINHAMSAASQAWEAFESVTAAWRAMRMNAYSIILQNTTSPKIAFETFERGAVMSPLLNSINIPVRPVCIIHPVDGCFLTRTYASNVAVSALRRAEWLSGNFIVNCAPNQEAIDGFYVAPDSMDAARVEFDFYVFEQNKLVKGGGLQKAVFVKRKDFGDAVVAAHSSATGHKSRYALGILNPVKIMSRHCREFIESGEMPAFGVGREQVVGGSAKYFGPIAGHPALLPYIFINSATVKASDLALLLAGSEAAALNQAKEIIRLRPLDGYACWNDVEKAVAGIKLDEECQDCLRFD